MDLLCWLINKYLNIINLNLLKNSGQLFMSDTRIKRHELVIALLELELTVSVLSNVLLSFRIMGLVP